LRRFTLGFVFGCALCLAGGTGALSAQDSGHGSNFDPPPRVVRPAEPPPPAAPPETPAEPPIDWTSKDSLLKSTLLVGGLLLAVRTARQMRA